MAILALEFSTAHRGVAALDPATGRAGEAVQTAGRATDAFGLIEEALSRAALPRDDVDRVVVGLGPGSYTGIRNALAIAQGWQFAREIRVAGFSSVEALAFTLQAEGHRGPHRLVVDAQRGEFYLARWRLADAGPVEETPLRIVSRETALAGLAPDARLVGPGADRLPAPAEPAFPAAALLARMAATRDAWTDAAALEPIYLRPLAFVKAPPPRKIPPLPR
jgi:tRNA threonylcarbamoyl adenosine modification protein YeaZ